MWNKVPDEKTSDLGEMRNEMSLTDIQNIKSKWGKNTLELKLQGNNKNCIRVIMSTWMGCYDFSMFSISLPASLFHTIKNTGLWQVWKC